MATTKVGGLTELQRKRIRDRQKQKLKTRGYEKGHVARTKGKKISDVPTRKSTAKPKPRSELNESQKAARDYAKAHKKALHKTPSSGGKSAAQKTYATAASKGATMAHRKKVHDPKSTHKDWRTKHMDAAKRLTGTAKRNKMRQVDNAYRKKIGLKAKTYA